MIHRQTVRIRMHRQLWKKSICITSVRQISLIIHLGLLWLICFAPIYFKVGKIFGYYGLTIKAGIMPYGMFLGLGIVAETAAGILFIRLLEKLAQKLKVRNYVLAVHTRRDILLRLRLQYFFIFVQEYLTAQCHVSQHFVCDPGIIGSYPALLPAASVPILCCVSAVWLRGIPNSGNECVPAGTVPLLYHTSAFLHQ